MFGVLRKEMFGVLRAFGGGWRGEMSVVLRVGSKGVGGEGEGRGVRGNVENDFSVSIVFQYEEGDVVENHSPWASPALEKPVVVVVRKARKNGIGSQTFALCITQLRWLTWRRR